MLERIVETNNSALIKAYESKLQELEFEKAVLAEKSTNSGKSLPSFDEHSRTALDFLRNPYKLWTSGELVNQRNVLRLCFTRKLVYDKNEGYRTASKALPIRVLEGLDNSMSDMVPGEGESSNRNRDLNLDICKDFENTDLDTLFDTLEQWSRYFESF